MATESLPTTEARTTAADYSWKARHPSRGEMPADMFDRRIAQAEALAHALQSEGFSEFNTVIQTDVMSLLSDTITEARIAFEEMREAKQ